MRQQDLAGLYVISISYQLSIRFLTSKTIAPAKHVQGTQTVQLTRFGIQSFAHSLQSLSCSTLQPFVQLVKPVLIFADRFQRHAEAAPLRNVVQMHSNLLEPGQDAR